MSSDLQEKLSRASADVRHACALLVCPIPEVLDQCSVLLETTARDLAGSHSEPGGKQSTLQEARELLRAVRHARVLLDSALAFRQVWSRRLGVMTAGYTARGEPARVDRNFRLAVRG